MKLTLYLFKSNIVKFGHCLKPEDQKRKYRDITKTVEGESKEDLKILLIDKQPKVPTWASFIGGHINPEVMSKELSHSPAAIILFRVKDGEDMRIMAATNGSSYSAIDMTMIEPEFGLKTALSSISPTQIKSIDYKDLSARNIKKSESTKYASPIARFGLAFDNEMVKSVTGKALDGSLGNSITGSSSLKLTIPDLKLAQLPVVGQMALERYKSGQYRANFDFIDNLTPVNDESVVAEFNLSLIENFTKLGGAKKLAVRHLNQPALLEADHLQLTVKGLKEIYDELDTEVLTSFIQGAAPEVTIEALKIESYVMGCDISDGPMSSRWKLYDLLAYQHTSGEDVLTLHEGSVYQVSKKYLDSCKAIVKKAISPAKPYSLQAWQSSVPEKHYGELQSQKTPQVDLTSTIFQSKGHPKVQLGDVYDKSLSQLVFFKRTNSARSLSFIADSILTTAMLIRDKDPSLLKTAKDKIGISEEDLSKRASFALIIGHQGDDIDELPAFDIITLKQLAKSLSRLGFTIDIAFSKLS